MPAWELCRQPPGRRLVLAEVDEQVCGVVGFEASVDDGWVHSLYVAPEVQGHGVGSTLLRGLMPRALTDS